MTPERNSDNEHFVRYPDTPEREQYNKFSNQIKLLKRVRGQIIEIGGELTQLDTDKENFYVYDQVTAIQIINARTSLNEAIAYIDRSLLDLITEKDLLKTTVVKQINLLPEEEVAIEKTLDQISAFEIVYPEWDKEQIIKARTEYYTRILQLVHQNFDSLSDCFLYQEEALDEDYSPQLSHLIRSLIEEKGIEQRNIGSDIRFLLSKEIDTFTEELKKLIPEEFDDDLDDEKEDELENEFIALEETLWQSIPDLAKRDELLTLWEKLTEQEKEFIVNDPTGFETSLILRRNLSFQNVSDGKTPEDLTQEFNLLAKDFTDAVIRAGMEKYNKPTPGTEEENQDPK